MRWLKGEISFCPKNVLRVLRSIMTAVLLYRRNSNSASISWRHRVFLVRVLKIVSRTARQCVTEKRIRVSVLHDDVSTVFLDSRFPIPPLWYHQSSTLAQLHLK